MRVGYPTVAVSRVNSNLKQLRSSPNPTIFSPTPLSAPPSSNLEHLKQLHAKLLRTGEILNTLVAGKLIADIANSHPSNLPYAHSLFTTIQTPLNTFTWNSMIRAYAHASNPLESISVYRQMLAEGFQPNNYTYPFVLKASATLPYPRIGLSVHATLIRRGFEDFDPFIQTALVTFYSSCGSIKVAQDLFDRCLHRDVAAWNALIKGYIGCSKYADAIRVFRVMQDGARVRGDEITMMSIVSACAQLGALDMGRWIHAHIGRDRLRLTLNLATALVNMYARCGDIDSACSLFRAIPEKDVRTWSVMISGLAVHGFAKEALDLFSEMERSGIEPDSVTFTGILNACCHGGLVREGMSILDQIGRVYFIEATIEHYGCMVDLLGRAGQLDEALALIERMPLEPDVILWGALLVACRVHKNFEMGEMAAKKMLELDPFNAGAHVFLSNLYAATGNWNLVEQVRGSMKEQSVYKPPGSSLIEVDGNIHEFLSGDHSHPQSNEIYTMLDEIVRLVRLRGHKSTTGGISFDIHEEDKEVCLSQHSEKLAVAFGLISTSPGTVLRIVKNLRVCEDCHVVMKLVSKIFNRIIIVRDRNRFHHFKDGYCSCRDYW